MNKIVVLPLLCFMLSCSEKIVEKPKNLISKDKMTSILYNLAIFNAAKNTNATILTDNNIETMDFIFAKYKIDSLQFVTSDIYYASLPIIYEAIYIEIDKRLEKERERMRITKIQADSIKLIKSKS